MSAGIAQHSAPSRECGLNANMSFRRLELKPTPPPNARAVIPTSVVLQRLHDEAPKDHFTLGWLMGSLQKRSFGIIMLLLALVAMAPGVSIVAGLLLMIPAFEMIAGRPTPVFPRSIAARPLPTRHLAALVQRAVPVLRHLEKVIHPRWPTPLEATKRLVGTVVVMLNITLVFTPIPLSNVVPALVIALISLAYLEEDGLLLSIALLASRHRAGGRVGGGLGDDPRREMDLRPLVAHRGVRSSDLSADFTLIFVKNRMSAIVLSWISLVLRGTCLI